MRKILVSKIVCLLCLLILLIQGCKGEEMKFSGNMLVPLSLDLYGTHGIYEVNVETGQEIKAFLKMTLTKKLAFLF